MKDVGNNLAQFEILDKVLSRAMQVTGVMSKDSRVGKSIGLEAFVASFIMHMGRALKCDYEGTKALSITVNRFFGLHSGELSKISSEEVSNDDDPTGHTKH